jgi:hypothetical protein
MSNKYILIAITAVVIAASGIFILAKSRPTDIQSNVSTALSSSLNSVIVKNLQLSSSSSVVVSSSMAVSSVTETPKVETPPVVESKPVVQAPANVAPQPVTPTPQGGKGSNPNPVQDIPNVTKLSTDKSMYHQYIKDYLACSTKFYQPLNGGYIYEGISAYKYLCIPQKEINNCSKGVLQYGLKPTAGNKIFSNKFEFIEEGKFYCMTNIEGEGSVTLPYNYYQNGVLNGLTKSLPQYFIIPKYDYSISIPTYAAIPLESFSQSDQEYIAKNFSIK